MMSHAFFFALSLLIVYTGQAFAQDEDKEHRSVFKFGEFNERCRSARDCRPFGYVCRDNRTCQCDYMYIPNANRRSCVGGINQRCAYDEHCIEGAFCLNQAVCKCKESSPLELHEGLVCSGSSAPALVHIFWCISLLHTLRLG